MGAADPKPGGPNRRLRSVPTRRRKARRDPTTPVVRYRTIHGYRRAYLTAGTGPTLLLLHGIGDSSESWIDLLPTLAEDHHVIAPDLLGHGRSDKPRADYAVAAYANGMRDLLSVLDVERVTVVGHSLGGGVAAQFAYQFPERCERLVLVSSGGVSRQVSPLLRLAASPVADLGLPALGLPPVRVANRFLMEVLRRTGTDLGRDAGELLRVLEGLPDGDARRAFTRTLRSVVDWRGQVVTMLDRCYLAAEMPTLLVWGAHDAVIPVAHAHLAHQAMPGSRLEVFDDAGHFPHHTDPDRFVTVLRDFLTTTDPARHEDTDWRELLRQGGSLARPALRPHRPQRHVGVPSPLGAAGEREPGGARVERSLRPPSTRTERRAERACARARRSRSATRRRRSRRENNP